MTQIKDDPTIILNNLFPQNRESLSLKALPIYSIGLGVLAFSGSSLVSPASEWQWHLLAGVGTWLAPYTGYFGYRLWDRIQDRRLQARKIDAQLTLKLEREHNAHELEMSKLAIRRAEASSERARIHLQQVVFEKGVDRAIENGHNDVETSIRQQHERDQWRRVLSILYSEGNLEKTTQGTWSGGQPLTLHILGRKRQDALRAAGLIYMKEKHPQWSVEAAGDSNEAMRRLEAVGIFNIFEKWGW